MDNRKIIVASYLLVAIVVWFLCRSGIQYFYVSFYQVRRIPGIVALREILPIILGVVGFIVLISHAKVNLVLDEVVSELRKVTWPNRDEVVRSSTVVIICILFISFVLAGFDLVWGKLVTYLLQS